MTRAAIACLLLAALLAPCVAASPASVRLESAGALWNGASEATATAGFATVWLPPGARVHAVTAGGASASWRAAGPDAILVATGNATSARVEFDFSPGAVAVARYVAPEDVELELRVVAPTGTRVESPDAMFFLITESGGGGSSDFASERLPQGASVLVRVVAADRVATSTLFLALAAVALVVLLAALVWHRIRPPGGKEGRFVEHLVELQQRLLPPVVAFGALNILYFVVGLRMMDVGGAQLAVPAFDVDDSIAARAYQALAERLVPEGVDLVALRPVDAVLAQVQLALFLAFLTALPLLVYEVGAFIGPALVARERSVAGRALPVVTGLFLAGAAFGLLLMAPLMMRTLYGYAPAVGARPLLSVSDLVSFALLVTVAFALAFELPVAMFTLARIGVVKASTFRRYLRHAVVVIFVAAGIVTPDPSVVSQLLVGLPVALLYVVGLGAAALGERRPLPRVA